MAEREIGTPITAGDLLKQHEGIDNPDAKAPDQDVIVDYVQPPLSQEQMDKALVDLAEEIDQQEQSHEQPPVLPALDDHADEEETQPSLQSHQEPGTSDPDWMKRVRWDGAHHRLPEAVINAPTD